MDNGLISPYPCVGARDESAVLTTQNRIDHSPSGVWSSGAAWELRW